MKQAGPNLRVEIQRVILGELAFGEFFSRYVFQGGTCLHFFYENIRWSEDLDFVKNRSNPDRPSDDAPWIESTLKEAAKVLPSLVKEVESAEAGLQKRGERVRFAVRALLRGERHKLRVNVEIADVPAYRISVKPFRQGLVSIEDSIEILADKLVAVAARSRDRLKARDVLDLHYLGEGMKLLSPSNLAENLDTLADLTARKLEDYRISPEDFEAGVNRLREWLMHPESLQDLKRTFLRYALPARVLREQMAEPYCQGVLDFVRSQFNEPDGVFAVLLRRLTSQSPQAFLGPAP